MPSFSDRMREANQNRHRERLSKYPLLKELFGDSSVLILVEGPTDVTLINKVVYAAIKSPQDPCFSYSDNCQGQAGVKRFLVEKGPQLKRLLNELPIDNRNYYTIFGILDKDNEECVPTEYVGFNLFYYDAFDLENFVLTPTTYYNYVVSRATSYVEHSEIEEQRKHLEEYCKLLTALRSVFHTNSDTRIQRIIREHFRNRKTIRELIKKELRTSREKEKMDWNNQYTRGKELIWLLMASVKNFNFKQDFTNVLSELTVTFIHSDFSKSRLYSDLQKFQQATSSSLQFKVYQ